MEKLDVDESLYTSNDGLTVSFPTQTIEQLQTAIANENAKFTKELTDLLSKHMKSISFKQTVSRLQLTNTRSLKCGVSLFRKFVHPGTQMASCNSFICFGYLENGSICLEFLSRDERELRTVNVESSIGKLCLLSSKESVGVVFEERKILIYEAFDSEPIESECGPNPLGMAKVQDRYVFLSFDSSKIRWYPMIFPDFLIESWAVCIRFAEIVLDPSKDCRMILCLYDPERAHVNYLRLSDQRYLHNSVSFGNGFGHIHYLGCIDHGHHFRCWAFRDKQITKSVCDVVLTDSSVLKSDKKIMSLVSIDEPVVDLHCWDGSCFFKTKSNQIVEVGNVDQCFLE